jgi:hypothetical protein
LIDVFSLHSLERIDPARAMRNIRFDFFERPFRHEVAPRVWLDGSITPWIHLAPTPRKLR